MKPLLLTDLYLVLQHVGVAVSAVAGALAARGRKVDLFGVVVLALVTALGGGTLRDMCLGATPVFWIADWRYALTSVVTGIGMFWLIRHLHPLLTGNGERGVRNAEIETNFTQHGS